MVAAKVLKPRMLAAAVVAAIALISFALHGERQQGSLARFEAAGPMSHIAPATISHVEIAVGDRRWHFVRDGARWRSGKTPDAAEALDAALSERLETGLKLLHVAAPERVLSGDELAAQASFGLDPPALSVIAQGATRFAVDFGAANPIGLARYARIGGDPRVTLLPAYVAQAWEQVVASQ